MKTTFRHRPPTLTATLCLIQGVVLHRVGFRWSDGWFQAHLQTPDLEAARAAFYAAEAAAAIFPAVQTQKAV